GRWRRRKVTVGIGRKRRCRVRFRRSVVYGGGFSLIFFGFFLFRFGFLRSLQHFLADFRAQLIDPFLRLFTFRRTGLLPDHFVVINYRRAIRPLFVIITSHIVRAARGLVLQQLEISTGLRRFFA